MTRHRKDKTRKFKIFKLRGIEKNRQVDIVLYQKKMRKTIKLYWPPTYLILLLQFAGKSPDNNI